MDQTVVKATEGRARGTRPSRRLRAEGQLPAVVYGLDAEPQPVSVSYAELRHALSGKAGMNTVLTLDIDGTQQTVLVRAVQRDPIKRVATHADFLRVEPNKRVRVRIPINLVGDDLHITSTGAMVEQKRFFLDLMVPPNNIPLAIEVDMADLTFDNRISVGDLKLPDGASTPAAEDISVAAVVVPRSVLLAAGEDELEGEEGEGEEGEEGAEGEGDGDAEASNDAEGGE
ncbi:MAG: 50S ribosomal protein L25 [Acidimicrobiia bacterium]|nr:50S ribosomal protein L25 [Acidimicrobiia bacterium]